MALFNSFTFDNENSLDSGIYITGEAVFNAPERAVEMVNVPGRNGAIAIDEGRFENIPVTYPAGCYADNMADFAEKVAKFRNILASRFTYKRLTDSYHPDEFRMGLYRSGLEVDAVRYNSAGEFKIEFDCKPQRFLLSGEVPTEYIVGMSPSDEQTKTGSIVAFEAEEDTIISDVKVDINPIQSLNGYDKPWAGGNGKNILNVTNFSVGETKTMGGVSCTYDGDGTFTLNGTTTQANVFFNLNYISGSAHALPTNAPFNIGYAAENNSGGLVRIEAAGGTGYTKATFGSSKTFGISDDIDRTTTTATSSWARLQIQNSGVTLTNVKIRPFVCMSSNKLTAYEPYSNICPISGWDSVKVTRTGKNLLNRTLETFTRAGITFTANTDGTVVATGTATDLAWVDYGTVDLKGGVEYKLNGGVAALHYVVVKGYPAWKTGTADKAFTPPSDMTATIQIVILKGEHANGEIFKPMIRLASETDATYEPYQSDTYTIDLKGKKKETGDGTRYGGTLDVVNGVLKVCPYYASYNGETLTGEWISDRDEYSPNTSPTIGAQVVNIGGSLSTVQLTPTEVSRLLGTNNIWADSGDITVKYGTNPYLIINPTDFPSKPLLEVTGVGSFWLGDTQITITGTSGQIIYIDCETGECYKEAGGIISSANGLVTLNRLDFPELASGINNIQLGSVISKVKITPRWWRL